MTTYSSTSSLAGMLGSIDLNSVRYRSGGSPFVTRTEVRLLVESHNFGHLDLSEDVLSYSYEKGIRDPGSLQINLAPRREYLDVLHANDVVNLYVNMNNPHEPCPYNRGWVRRFFGYVDEIRRTEEVVEGGTHKVSYSLVCTDFQKAVMMTEILNNPYIAMNEAFGNNLGGSYLMFQGAVNMGNPRFLVMNLMAVLFGYGRQWILPPHYDEEFDNPIQPLSVLSATPHFAASRVKNDAIDVVQRLRNLAERFSVAFSQREAMEEQVRIAEQAAVAAGTTFGQTERFRVRVEYAKNAIIPPTLPAQLTIDNSAPWQIPKTIYDILCFDYVEYTDGFINDLSIWEHQGSLYDIILQYSHQGLNELMFDLRPTIDFQQGGIDSVGNNIGDGIVMLPCVSLREHPFTYYPRNPSDSMDFNQRIINTSELFPYAANVTQASAIDFGGSVWRQSNRVTDYGDCLGLNTEVVQGLVDGDSAATTRFNRGIRVLENIQISSQDVFSASLGRGDQDIVSGYDFLPETSFGDEIKNYIRDIVPQFRLLQIRRHGLRMRDYVTSFAQALAPIVARPDVNTPATSVVNTSGNPLDNPFANPFANPFITVGDLGYNMIDYMSLRSVMLNDHWFQHNGEYLNGSISLRSFPGIRPGYRLDWAERGLSFYVEAISEEWTFGGRIETTVNVSRGQPIDGLEYILPDSRIKREYADSFWLGINFPVADSQFSEEYNANAVSSFMNQAGEKRFSRRRIATPGNVGRYSPPPLIQNFRRLKVPFPIGVNLGGNVITDQFALHRNAVQFIQDAFDRSSDLQESTARQIDSPVTAPDTGED